MPLTEDILINTSDEDDVELLIDPEEDMPNEEIEIEMEEVIVDISSSDTINLAESLEQKSQSGEGSLRLDRRIKRKEEREQKEKFDSFVASMPPPPLPGQITHASDDTQQETPLFPICLYHCLLYHPQKEILFVRNALHPLNSRT